MFSAFAGGTFLFVTGLIGWNASHMHGFFEGGRWSDGPIWSQVALGVGFLLLGVHWARRLPGLPSTTTRTADRVIKNVGSGQTSAAAHTRERDAQSSRTVRELGR